ncbi:MAG: tetratricopeptide repeat protein [Solirubrobacteraceae bacterium]|nr:tetratricopeptide repeat protein [Solirubrobacteraceae bacterium]
MSATIQLLGAPAILRDGQKTAGPKGRKAWALLAYLLLAERPAGRRAMAEFLFADAADPLGALRWNLAQLRRALDGVATIEGDPVRVTLAPDVTVDAHSPAAGGDLLEGIELDTSPAFASWLVVARGRYAGQAAAALHDGALHALTSGDADRAADLAAQLVALDPFDEQHHELLVRALVARGDRTGAVEQVEACRRLFRRELDCEPSAALRQAASETAGTDAAPVTGRHTVALARLEAGEAALAAGAAEHGVNLLRQACREADACGDDALHGRALLHLGGALVEAVRGRDEEGALCLHQALALAESAGDRETIVGALRELAYTDLQAGRRTSVEQRLMRAGHLATSDRERASILAVQGQNRSDMGDYPGALSSLTQSIEQAERAGEPRRVAFSMSLVGRIHLLRGDDADAITMLDRSLEITEAERWLAFLPWPEALRAEADLRQGETARAADRLHRAFALACDLQDPCWEGMAARGLSLLDRAEGEPGRSWIDEARVRCGRLTDRYVWVQGHVLDAAISVELDAGDHESAATHIRSLRALAARTEMRELVVRSLVHAAHLGDRGAVTSARVLAAEIENPVLGALVEAHA